MATKEQIQESYNRAKARYDAQRANQLRQASENLALQTRQINQLKGNAQESATQQASQAYVSAQQQQRVLPSQLAQSGLGNSGYRSLAQQKMAQDLTKTRQGVETGLAQTVQGYQRSAEADKLNYDQNVRNISSDYSQDIAGLNLNRKQDLENLANREAEAVTNVNRVPTGYNQNLGGKSTPPQTIDFAEMVRLANQGQFTYEQYKAMLNSSGREKAEINAYLTAYLRAQAQRDLQKNNRTGEQFL